MFTVFIEKESASSDGGFGEIIPEDAQVDASDDSTIELAPGAIVDLNEGEKAHDMNPGRPTRLLTGSLWLSAVRSARPLKSPMNCW